MSLFYYSISPSKVLDFEIKNISACGKRVLFEAYNGLSGDLSILSLGQILEERDNRQGVVEIFSQYQIPAKQKQKAIQIFNKKYAN